MAETGQVRMLEGVTVTDTGDAEQTVTAALPREIEDGENLYLETRNDVSVFIGNSSEALHHLLKIDGMPFILSLSSWTT